MAGKPDVGPDGLAEGWASLVRAADRPESLAVANRALVDLALQVPVGPILDAGCGEGWLTRELRARGHEVHAIDASPAMVALAQAADPGGTYEKLSFSALAQTPRRVGVIGTAIFSFSLADDDPVGVLRALADRLLPYGRVLIQTAHPLAGAARRPYGDGWTVRGPLSGPGYYCWSEIPLYFRSVSSWLRVLRNAGLLLVETFEPVESTSGLPTSLLIHATIPEPPRRRAAARTTRRNQRW